MNTNFSIYRQPDQRMLETFPNKITNRVQKQGEMKLLSRVRLFAIPWTVTRQASLSMTFSRQQYWSGLRVATAPTNSRGQ